MTEFDYKAPPMVFPGQGPEHAYRTAYEFLAQRLPNEALDLITPALADDPTNSGLRQLQAWAFMVRAQLGRAEEVLSALVEERPDDVWSRHALGRVLERQSRHADALGHLKLAAAMSDDYDHQASVYRVTRAIERDAGTPAAE